MIDKKFRVIFRSKRIALNAVKIRKRETIICISKT